jgi:hypothetical protein
VTVLPLIFNIAVLSIGVVLYRGLAIASSFSVRFDLCVLAV